MVKEYLYHSIFAEWLYTYVRERRMSGFSFDTPAYWLSRFDRFCVEKDVKTPILTKELFDEWAISISDTKVTRNSRLQALKTFSVYLNSLGIESYIPHILPKPEKVLPYLLDDKEIQEFFQKLDEYTSKINGKFKHNAYEYRIMFRLLYCCGLRNNEVCSLKIENVDLDKGMLTIIHSKGDKDRLVAMADDVNEMCRNHITWIYDTFGKETIWMFPSNNPQTQINKTTLDNKFNQIWQMTESSKRCDKKPTVHSFRHAFVIRRMNTWMENDVDLRSMMPYLSSYLGHGSPSETQYYYHQIEKAFATIKRKDTQSSIVIPEVKEND